MIIVSFPVLLTMAVIIGVVSMIRGYLRNPMSLITDLLGTALLIFLVFLWAHDFKFNEALADWQIWASGLLKGLGVT